MFCKLRSQSIIVISRDGKVGRDHQIRDRKFNFSWSLVSFSSQWKESYKMKNNSQINLWSAETSLKMLIYNYHLIEQWLFDPVELSAFEGNKLFPVVFLGIKKLPAMFVRLWNLVSRLINTSQSHSIRSFLLFSSTESAIQVCRPLLPKNAKCGWEIQLNKKLSHLTFKLSYGTHIYIYNTTNNY